MCFYTVLLLQEKKIDRLYMVEELWLALHMVYTNILYVEPLEP